MTTFLERFVLAVLAACFIAFTVTNVADLGWLARGMVGLTMIVLAVLAAKHLHRQKAVEKSPDFPSEPSLLVTSHNQRGGQTAHTINNHGIPVHELPSLVQKLHSTADSITESPRIVQSARSVPDEWDVIVARYSDFSRYWESLLTADLIEHSLLSANRRLSELHAGLVHRRIEFIPEDRVFDKTRELFAEAVSISERIDPALKQIVPAWGPLGVPGNPDEIRRACARVRDLINALVEWETEVYFLHPSCDRYIRLLQILRGTTQVVFQELNRIPPGLRYGVEKARTEPGPHLIDLRLTIGAPPNMEEFRKEVQRLEGGLFSWF